MNALLKLLLFSITGVILFSCLQFSPLLAENSWQLIYTTKSNYTLSLVHDADSLEYRLFNSNSQIKRGTVLVNNPQGKRIKTNIPLYFPKEGTYKLEIVLKDDVQNRSYKYTRAFIYKQSLLPWESAKPNNTAILGVNKCKGLVCKNLNIEYINQAVNDKGQWESWKNWPTKAGGQACGASASVMVNDYFNRLPDQHRLKSYVFQDNNQKLKQKKCSRPGVFAVTAYNSACNQSSLGSIRSYLNQYQLNTTVHWAKNSNHDMNIIKSAINKGRPVILSYRKPIGHIMVVKGYTQDGRLVVHDPYRDIQGNYIRGKYDYSGKDVVYKLVPNNKFQVNYFIEVYK